jgi:hypothetical protein
MSARIRRTRTGRAAATVQGRARTTLDGAHRGVGVREIHIRERHAGTGHHDLRTRVGAEDLRLKT